MSTWVIEAPEATWAKAEASIGKLSEAETVAYLEKLWAHLLKGHRLIANRSSWRASPVVRCKNWYYRNIVLLGDALHTAHFSIGSGTKLAMEDAITLYEAFVATDTVPDALARFQGSRREDVEKPNTPRMSARCGRRTRRATGAWRRSRPASACCRAPRP